MSQTNTLPSDGGLSDEAHQPDSVAGAVAPGELSPLELKVFVAKILAWPHWRIAMNCGISEASVAQIVVRPRFKAAMAKATAQVIAQGAQVATRIAELAPKAIERVAYLMENSKSDSIQMRTAFDVLDRAGYKPVERSVQERSYVLQTEDAALLNETLKQSHELRNVGGTFVPESDIVNVDGVEEVRSWQPHANTSRPPEASPRDKQARKSIVDL